MSFLLGVPRLFPKTHVAVVCLIAAPLVSLILAPTSDDSVARVSREGLVSAPLVDKALAHFDGDKSPVPRSELTRAGSIATPPSGAHTPEAVSERVEKVRAGDSLARVFERLSLSPGELAAVLKSGPLGGVLKSIYPGHELKFVTSEDKRLMKLSYAPDPLKTLEFNRDGDAFFARQITRQARIATAYRHATIAQSLFGASQQIGLSDDLTLRLAQIFQWDVDFVLDIRKGDQFAVVFEERYANDEFIGYGNILAAEFVNQGTRYIAVYYADIEGHGDYYNASGESMRKAFLRAPVEFSRISSNFNPRRLHPIQKRVMPHRGIDYVAPAGTPILAAGDGRVLKAMSTAPNGNFITLQHAHEIQTKYLHLSKFARGVRSGSQVRQGQVIGYVGATGWATAPHLHYEFLVDGAHQNPRTVPLPKAHPIPSKELARFRAQSEPLLVQLANPRAEMQLARVQ